ncbi:MAG: hypothetical protein PHI90_11295 [Clostridia bacterium]|nr:hypothetical protein [Clostridia bacterium]MDD4049371.1 hypothetical protein [Clostridia bacterium]
MSFESHNYAIKIEGLLRDVFDCDRAGFGGIADADFIERSAYTAIACALARYYGVVSEKEQKKIEEYLNRYSFYSDKRLEDIIKEFKNSEVETMINEFKSLLKELK